MGLATFFKKESKTRLILRSIWMTKEVLRCLCLGVETEAWHWLLYTSQIWGFHRVIIVHLLTIKCCDEPLPSSDVTAGSRTPVITAPLSRRCRRGRRSGDEEEIAQTQQNRSVNKREIRVCRWHSWQHWLGDKCIYDAGMWISRQLVSLSSLSLTVVHQHEELLHSSSLLRAPTRQENTNKSTKKRNVLTLK